MSEAYNDLIKMFIKVIDIETDNKKEKTNEKNN
jgi:hypothetical protein